MLETPEGGIFESNTICRYIAAHGTGPLFPNASSSPKDIRWAQVDQWVDWVNSFDAVAPGTFTLIPNSFHLTTHSLPPHTSMKVR